MDNSEFHEGERSVPEALQGDPRRRASATVRGFMYQFWRTVLAWIELEPDGVLYVEGAEDFDLVSEGEATAVQIKDNRASGTLTLGNAGTVTILNQFWKLKAENRGLRVRFKYVTTAGAGSEQEGPPGRKAIEVWNICREAPISSCSADVEAIRQILLGRDKLDASLRQFLDTALPEAVGTQLIEPIEWLYDQPTLQDLEAVVVGHLIKLGESHGLTTRDAGALARRLYETVQNAAIARSPQRLDFIAFRQELERATIVEIPRQSLQRAGRIGEAIDRLVAGTANVDADLPRVIEGPEAFAMPVAARGVWRRQDLIERVRSALTGGIAYLDGSAGIGKTTLLLQAIEPGQEVLWAHIRGVTDAETAAVCRVLAQQVTTAKARVVVVLDDLNPEDDPRVLEPELARLGAAIRGRGSALAIASYRPAGPRMAALLGMRDVARISVPPFQQEEVGAYLLEAGCPAERSGMLARLVWLHTGGHPQLVAARISALTRDGFPEPALEDILDRPKEIQDAHAEALATVRSVLPEDARNMLYRLSLVFPAFRRAHALRIGAGLQGTAAPGEAFDRLAGPWLEEQAPDHYKVSGIVSRCGEQALAPDDVKRLHGDIATALLAERVMTPGEFGGAVMHALTGDAAAQLAMTSQIFLTARRDIKVALAREMPWMALAGVEPNTHLPVSNKAARQFVRLMQLDVAALVSPRHLDALARVTEADFTAESDDLTEILPRLLYLSKLLLCIELRMAPARIIGDVLEVEHLARKAGKQGGSLLKGSPRLIQGGKQLGDLFVVVLVPRIRTTEDIDALVVALDALDAGERDRLLSWLGPEDGEMRILFLGPWVSLSADDRGGFERYADVLAEAMSAGRRWQHAAWTRSAARARSAVLDEKLGRQEEAEALLVDVAAEVGSSLSLEDQLAGIAFNHKEDVRALEIWERILPQWRSDQLHHDPQPVFGARHAAVSAGRLGRWDKAADLFEQAQRRAERFSMRAWRLGLLGDRGFALWKSGDRKAAVKVFAKAVAELETLPNKPESFAEYAVQKLVGNVLIELGERKEAREPLPPGMCSDLKPDERIGQLPPTPPVYLWFLLGDLATTAKDLKLAARCAEQYRDAPYALLRGMAARENIRQILRSRKLSNVLEASVKQAVAMEQQRERGDMGPGEPDSPGLRGELTESSVGAFVRPALWAAMMRAKALGQDGAKLVGAWRTLAQAETVVLHAELDLWQTYATASTGDLARVLKGDAATFESRTTAAVFLLDRDDAEPGDVLYAQTVILAAVAAYKMEKYCDGASIELLVRKDWLRLCDRRFLLRSPHLYVDAIRKACESRSTGWSAAARIVLAAAPTTNVLIPDTVRTTLERLAGEPSSAPVS